MSGNDKVASAGEIRLEQPEDAVAMHKMAQPSGAPDHTPGSEPVSDTPRPSKGKERADSAPKPPSKEENEGHMAIGSAQDDHYDTSSAAPDAGPVCNITLLLTSGNRHPYKIDAKYLARRNVTVPDETEHGLPDPFSISVYTLKELILREWRHDWEAKPASPTSIRLIHFGKLLDDKEQLRKYQFSVDHPNVVHMSIRPSDLDDEEPKAGSKAMPAGGAEGQDSRSRRGCCVVL
ncbi:hypothetical protein CDD81_2708 [Ophiocordyceps australis]|uniref:UBL3-like ubiquitin domain-containing protein n=1 Tax=Ophiocordyceps australis TaxID=1399860 RepID=A0A2C5YC56_9HYPO|nr:hypothetical protein CDD81_2708 [Ophiocordyceps australis]